MSIRRDAIELDRAADDDSPRINSHLAVAGGVLVILSHDQVEASPQRLCQPAQPQMPGRTARTEPAVYHDNGCPFRLRPPQEVRPKIPFCKDDKVRRDPQDRTVDGPGEVE